MSWEMVWDETWERQHPGYYVNDQGWEILKSDRGWVLNDLRNAETTHPTLKAAKHAADQR